MWSFPRRGHQSGLTRLQMLTILVLLSLLALVIVWKKERTRRIMQRMAERMSAQQARLLPKREKKYETIAAEKLVPESTFVYFTVPNLNKVAENFRRTALYALWREPSVKDFMVEPLERSQAMRDKIEGTIGVGLSVLKRVLNGQVAVSLFWREGKRGNLDAVIVADCIADRDRFEDIVYALLKRGCPPVGENAQWKSEVISGVTVYTRSATRGPIFYCYLKDTFVFAVSKSGIEEVIKNFKGEKGAPLSEKPEFKLVLQRISGENPIAALYVDTDEILEGLADKIGEDIVEKLRTAGVDSIKAIGYGIGYEDTGIKEKICLYAPKESRKGFANLLNLPRGEKKLLEAVPAGALSVSHANVDFQSLWEGAMNALKVLDEGAYGTLQEALASAEKATGVNIEKDLIRSLGNEIAGYIMPPTEGEERPKTVQLIKVKNVAKATKSLEALFKSVVPGAAVPLPAAPKPTEAVNAYWAATQHRNHTIRVLTSRQRELPISIAYAVVGDIIILSTSTGAVRKALDHIDQKTPSIIDDDDYKLVVSHLSEENSAINYFDLKQGMMILHKKALSAKGALEGFEMPFSFAKLPPEDVLARHMFGLATAAVSDDAGLTVETYSPMGNLGTIASSTVLASMALPASINIRDRVTSMMCKRNLVAVGRALRAYAAKNAGNLPDPGRQAKLLVDGGFVPNPKIFYCPATEDDPRTFPDNVSYEFTLLTYNLERDGEGRYPIAWDKFGNHPGGRHVLFIDGHVEFLSEEEFLHRIDNP